MGTDFGKLLLRIGVGGLMIFHGIHKLIHGHDFVIEQLSTKGLPTWLWLGVPIGEVVAPLFLILGIASRFSAAIIAFTMVMSIFLVNGMAVFNTTNTGGLAGELNLLFLFSSLAIAFIGPGKFRIYKGSGFLA